jgi:signal transduction histidine kinase
MQERVADLGGRLSLEARADGWVVHATIPVESTA